MVTNRLHFWLTLIISIPFLSLFSCGQFYYNKLPQETGQLIKASKHLTLTANTTGIKTGLTIDEGEFYSIIATGNVRRWEMANNLNPEAALGVTIGNFEQVAPPINATLAAQAHGEIGLFLKKNITRLGKFTKNNRTPQPKPNADAKGLFHITVIVWKTKDVDDISNFYEEAKSLNLGSDEIANLYYQSKHLKTYIADSKIASQSPKDFAKMTNDSPVPRPTYSDISGDSKVLGTDTYSESNFEELPDDSKITSNPTVPSHTGQSSHYGQKSTDIIGTPTLEDTPYLPTQVKNENAPLMLIVSPRNEQTITTGTTQLIGVIEDYNGLSLIEIRVNGKVLIQDNARGLMSSTPMPPKRYEFNKKVTLDSGKNEISIYARNTNGRVTQQLISLTQSRQKSKVFALIVGINSYSHLPHLNYAVQDAEAFRDLVLNNHIVSEENLFLLTDDDANINNLRRVLGTTLKRKAAKDDMVLIYFAGHGATERDANSPDGDGLEKYLLPVNAEPSDLYSTAIPMREISYIMNRINAEKLIFIADSCYSGASGGRTVAIESIRANVSDKFLDRLTGAKGRVVIAASGPNEVSAESDQLKHGIFTYHLLEALKGKADYDKDGFVTVDETYRYVSEKVPESTDQEQHPVKKGIVEGQLVLGIVN